MGELGLIELQNDTIRYHTTTYN